MLCLLTEFPEWSSAFALVVDTYSQSREIPGREQLRTGAMLRAHLRGVLRRLARGCAAVHEIDRCSELERAEAHCARIDYLCTLVASLNWRPRLEMELFRTRWLSLRRRLAEAREKLVQRMTWRSRDRPEPIVAAEITRSLPALLPAARAERPTAAALEIVSVAEALPSDTLRVGPAQLPADEGGRGADDVVDAEVECWVDELGSWLDGEPADFLPPNPPPSLPDLRSTAPLRGPTHRPPTADTISEPGPGQEEESK